MFQPETVLIKREPFEEDHASAPYNRVKVIGQSPINHGTIQTEWVGAQAQGVIIQPIDGFGSTLDEPYGKLVELYEIESVPENVLPAEQVIQHIPQDGSPSPEDIFRAEAREAEVEVKEPAKALDVLAGEQPSAEAVAEREALKEKIRDEASNN